MPGRGSHFTQLFHHDTAQVIRERIVVLAAPPVISKRAHHLDATLHTREIAENPHSIPTMIRIHAVRRVLLFAKQSS